MNQRLIIRRTEWWFAVVFIIFVWMQPYSTPRAAVRGPFTHLTVMALGSVTQGHARERKSSAALGSTKKKAHSANLPGMLRRRRGEASRLESKAVSPHRFHLPEQLSPSIHEKAEGQSCPVGRLLKGSYFTRPGTSVAVTVSELSRFVSDLDLNESMQVSVCSGT